MFYIKMYGFKCFEFNDIKIFWKLKLLNNPKTFKIMHVKKTFHIQNFAYTYITSYHVDQL